MERESLWYKTFLWENKQVKTVVIFLAERTKIYRMSASGIYSWNDPRKQKLLQLLSQRLHELNYI